MMRWERYQACMRDIVNEYKIPADEPNRPLQKQLKQQRNNLLIELHEKQKRLIHYRY
jgi:hypothetical protein